MDNFYRHHFHCWLHVCLMSFGVSFSALKCDVHKAILHKIAGQVNWSRFFRVGDAQFHRWNYLLFGILSFFTLYLLLSSLYPSSPSLSAHYVSTYLLFPIDATAIFLHFQCSLYLSQHDTIGVRNGKQQLHDSLESENNGQTNIAQHTNHFLEWRRQMWKWITLTYW